MIIHDKNDQIYYRKKTKQKCNTNDDDFWMMYLVTMIININTNILGRTCFFHPKYNACNKIGNLLARISNSTFMKVQDTKMCSKSLMRALAIFKN